MDETPKLFLETSLPTSASPYPSPSSAFYPPPIPASHEFANKLATLAGNKRYRGSGGAVLPPTTATPTTNGTTLSPSSTSSSRRGSASGPSPLSQEATSKSPTTPTPAPAKTSSPSHDRNSQRLSLGPLPPSTLSLPPTTPTTAAPPSANTTPSKRASQILEALTPIRAAPPSPAPSRRGSLIRRGSSRRWSGAGQSTHGAGTADSTTSSMVSEDGSTSGDVPEIAASKRASRRLSAFNALAALEPTVEGQVVNFGAAAAPTSKEAAPENATSAEDAIPAQDLTEVEASDAGTAAKPILVADFAFPEDDERFSKRPLELLTRVERTALGPGSSPATRPSDDEEWDEGPEDDEWSAVWLAGARPIDGEQMTPRFGNSNVNGDTNDGGAGGETDPDSPLPPGIYRALYAFEAEGTAEMSLTEGQLVRVVGRGGGVGWAVVERGWTEEGEGQVDGKEDEEEEETVPNEGSGALGLAGQALVPEGYLEIWRLEGEEW